MMEFYEILEKVLRPHFILNGNYIPIVAESIFLGLYWDPKLSWINQINTLKTSCMKTLDLFKTICALQYGPQTILDKPNQQA